MTPSRLHVYIFFALMLALLLPMPPAAGQAANPCLAAYQQQMQSIAKSRLELNDAYIKLQAQETIALNNCAQTQSTDQQCINQVVQQYVPLRKNLDDDGVLLNSAAAQANNNFNTSNCPWSTQEITQLISTLGQATSQITQSVAQVISAAKGKGTTGASQGGSQGSKAGQIPSPAQPPQKRTPPTTPSTTPPQSAPSP
jgi:hypothetical protein